MTSISIVTPSYNQGRFIEVAIRSILNQEYSHFEHIIIDGGSTDETLEILKKYPHLKWISEQDEGQSDALNKGFKLATGDVVGWLNADDYYLPNTFSIVSKELTNNKIDAVYANYRFVDIKGSITREIVSQASSKWMALFYCFIPSTTFFFKKDILKRGIQIDKHFHIAMDKEFFAHIYFSGFKIKKINAFFAHFRWHDNNKSIDTKQVKSIRFKEGIKIFNRYSGFRLPDNLIGISIYRGLIIMCGVYRNFSRFFRLGIYSNGKK